MDDRELFREYLYDPRKLSSSVISELQQPIHASHAYIIIGTIKKYLPDKGLYEVQLVSGPTVKAISILEDPVRGVFHGLTEGEKVYVLVVPGSGGVILKKVYPMLDDYEREDLERAMVSAVSHFLRNGSFFFMKEDETVEISLGNPFSIITLSASMLHLSHNAFVLMDSANSELRLGLMRRGSEIGEASEYYVALGQARLVLGEQYIGGVSAKQPETDPELGTLLGLLEHAAQGIYLFSNGVKLKSPTYVIVDYPAATVRMKSEATGVSVSIDMSGKSLSLSFLPLPDGFNVSVDYNGKNLKLVLSDSPVAGVDLSSNTPVTSFVSIEGGTDSGNSSVALSDKVILGMEQGATLSKTAYAGGLTSIPIGPVPPGGTGIVDLQKSLIGVQNMLELMKLTTPAGPIIPSGTVEFKSVIVDGSSSSLVKI